MLHFNDLTSITSAQVLYQDYFFVFFKFIETERGELFLVGVICVLTVSQDEFVKLST